MAKGEHFNCHLFDINWIVKTSKDNNLDQKIHNFQSIVPVSKV